MFEEIKIPDNITDIYIDVGLSHNAPHTVEWLSSNPNACVFGFEPVKKNCERVLDIIKNLKLEDRFKLFQCAVDNVDKPEVKNFYITCNSQVEGDHGQSSLYELTLKNSQGCEYWIDEVSSTLCVNLSQLFEVIDWGRFDSITCLKTDTQGNDLNIMKSIQPYFHRVPFIKCESYTFNHYKKNDDDPKFIYDYMTSNGYKLSSGDIGSADHFYTRLS